MLYGAYRLGHAPSELVSSIVGTQVRVLPVGRIDFCRPEYLGDLSLSRAFC